MARPNTFFDVTDVRLARADEDRPGTDKEYRHVTPADLAARERVVSSVFYGFPAEVIADWCAVPVKTAALWKNGQAVPSPTALKLFALYRERLVLGAEWKGWLINGDSIVDPEGNATTQGQLRAYYLNLQLLAHLCRSDPSAYAEYQRNLSMAG